MKWIGQIVNDVKVNFSNDGEIYVIGDDLYIENVTQDKDIIFKTNDGGTATEVMRIDGSTSNIGIGTSSPSQKMHVDGNIRVGDTADTIFSNKLFALGNADFTITSYNGYDLLLNPSAGDNVGIGTSSPASKLHVAGTVQVGVDDTGHDVIFYGATSGRYIMWDESSDRFRTY